MPAGIMRAATRPSLRSCSPDGFHIRARGGSGFSFFFGMVVDVVTKSLKCGGGGVGEGLRTLKMRTRWD